LVLGHRSRNHGVKGASLPHFFEKGARCLIPCFHAQIDFYSFFTVQFGAFWLAM